MVFVLIYVVGYVVTLIGLHRFKKILDIVDYDGPHDGYEDHSYDDWNSNAEAYAAWSFAWPLCWVILIICGVWYLARTFSSWLQNRV
jgi:hypothetical protein